jgi:hypothetical protein
MAKSRKKARKAPKRSAKKTAKKRKAVKAKARKPAKKTRRAKRRKQTSIADAVTGTVRESGELRSRLAGTNTFED